MNERSECRGAHPLCTSDFQIGKRPKKNALPISPSPAKALSFIPIIECEMNLLVVLYGKGRVEMSKENVDNNNLW